MLRKFRSRLAKKKKMSTKQQHARRLSRFEALEDRRLLSADSEVLWNTSFDSGTGNEKDFVTGIVADSSGNVFVTGNTQGLLETGGTAGSFEDVYVRQYDEDQNLIDTTQIEHNGFNFSNDIAIDSSGNVYITGRTTGYMGTATEADAGSSQGKYDLFVSKFNSSLTLQWTRQWGTGEDDEGLDVTVDGSGNLYITGQTQDYFGTDTENSEVPGLHHAGGKDVFIAKFDAGDGSLDWIKQLGTSAADIGNGVAADGLGNVYVAGQTAEDLDGGGYAGGNDWFLAKYESDGDQAWVRQKGTVSTDVAHDVVVDGLGNVYVSGATFGYLGTDPEGSNPSGQDAMVSKFDSDGNELWTEQIGGGSQQTLSTGITLDGLGNVYISGRTQNYVDNDSGESNAGSFDPFVSKFTDGGTRGILQWSEQFGTSAEEWDAGVATDGLGNVYIGGSVNPNGLDADGFVARIADYDHTFVVNSTADAADDNLGDGRAISTNGWVTLRAAIQEANDLDEPVEIYLPTGTYALSIAGYDTQDASKTDLDITGDITIVGDGAGLTVIDASALESGVYNWEEAAFEVRVGGELSLSGVTITGGHSLSGGAIRVGGGSSTATSLTVTDSAFVDNHASSSAGGAIRINGDSATSATILRSVFTGNSAGSVGGAIYVGDNDYMDVKIGSSVFAGNTATSSVPNARVESNTINLGNNLFDDTTGGLYDAGLGDFSGTVDQVVTSIADVIDSGDEGLSLREAVISANANDETIWLPAWKYDLTLLGYDTQDASKTDLDITGDVTIVGAGAGLSVIDASALESGVYNWEEAIFELEDGSALDLSRVTLTGGHSVSGGAIRTSDGTSTLTVTDVAFIGNTATNVGGAIRITGDSDTVATITGSVFTGNTATNYAGAIYVGDDDNMTVSIGSSVFADNTAGISIPNVRAESNTVNLGDNLTDDNTGSFFSSGTYGDYIGTAGYIVTSVADGIDSSDDAYNTTLREAVIEANDTSGADEIWLAPWLYALTVENVSGDEDGAVTGDLDIAEALTIRSADDSTISAELITDSVFEDLGSYLTLDSDITVVNS